MKLLNFADTLVHNAVEALEHHDVERHAILDAVPAPVYLTDPDGRVTYCNPACAEFAGRQPRPGEDRWCVTWKLHTPNDEPLPHDRCPMAVAIREKREVRGEMAIALRPDGGRRAFVPYPTPLLDDDGDVIEAMNILIDVSEEQSEALAEKARRCRRLAYAITDRYTAEILRGMADGYELNAKALGVEPLQQLKLHAD